MRPKRGAIIPVLLAMIALWATLAIASAAPIDPPALTAQDSTELPGLHNVVAYSEGLYSGSAPDDADAFDTLKAMGARTVISVDGAIPDVKSAQARGLRYIHLPIGYNGMDRRRTLEIAKAIQQAGGPVYIHCHHGKHRSAGATGAAAVALGLISNKVAEGKMRVSGTAPAYKGLFRCVADARPATPGELAAIPDAFPETWKTSGLVKAMVEAEEAVDHLNAVEAAGWRAPKESPDLVPAALAGQLADLLRNLQDDERVKSKPKGFIEDLLAASRVVEGLEDGLTDAPANAAALSARFNAVQQSCRDCHVKHRD